MSWSAYLTAQPPQDVEALVTNLTVGYGTLAFVVRQLTRTGELREVAGMLGQAEALLDRAYRQLARVPDRPTLPPGAVSAVDQPWQPYLTDQPDQDGAALLARLQDVVAQTGVVGKVIAADGTVEEISIHLRATLDQLQGLHVEMRSQD